MKQLSLIFIGIILCALLSGCGDSARTPSSAEEYIGSDHETVKSELERAGFTNIEMIENEDLTSQSELSDGDVGEISIDGNPGFKKRTSFDKNAPVVITYHTIRKIASPVSFEDVSGMEYTEVGTIFSDAGFTNVIIDEKYDLDPDETNNDHEDKIIVNNRTSFNKGDAIPYDAKISVVRHYPYEKYDVSFHIDFAENLIFSKYNVDFSVDGEKEDTLAHGKDADFKLRLKEGSHSFKFSKADSAKIEEIITLDITGTTNVSYKITCRSNEIEAKQNSIRVTEKKVLPLSASDCEGKNYNDIVDSLRNAGFHSISANIIYDIVNDELSEGETEKVTVNGKSDFKQGEKFWENDRIVVTYHLKEEDDPVKISEKEESEKRSVTLHIDFVPNLIFDKYDVNVLIDGKKEFTLSHGEDKDYEFRIKQGEHTLKFSKADDSSVNGEVKLSVTDDVEASYKIYCYYNSISITTVYVEYKNAAGENEIMMPSAASAYRNKNYNDIVKSLKDMGFTNVEAEPIYDIFFGITSAGSAESVSIDGKTDFNRGDVFSKDAEVIVKYHLNYEDDPVKIAEQQAAEEEKKRKEEEANKVYTIEDNADLQVMITLDRENNDDLIRTAVNRYKGRKIELDLITAYVEPYKNYQTRFNYLLFAVNDNNVMMQGPAFIFENVSYYDLHLTGTNKPEVFGLVLHCRVTAEVKGYEDGFILLDPVSIEVIKDYSKE